MQRNDGDKHVDPCQRSPEVDAMKKFGRSAPSPKIETATLPMLRAEQADIDAVRFPDLTDLLARLRFSTSDGCIWLDEQRMLLVHAKAMGSLRREMIESLGMDVARGLFTRMGYQAGMPPPIRLSDGFIPCSVDRPVQFDFQPRRGMVGVTCSVTAEDMSAFEQRMAGAFGEQQRASDGSRRWQLGGYSVGSVEVVVLGKTLRRVSVYQD